MDPSLQLLRMQYSWVNRTHLIRVMCKTATSKVSEHVRRSLTCGGPVQGWCVGSVQGSSTLSFGNEALGIELGEVLNLEIFNMYFLKTGLLHKPQKTQVLAYQL